MLEPGARAMRQADAEPALLEDDKKPIIRAITTEF